MSTPLCVSRPGRSSASPQAADLIERVTTLEALAHRHRPVLLVVGLTGVEGVFLLSLLSLLTAADLAATGAATDGAIDGPDAAELTTP